jgi:hypothetical protein
MSIAFACPACGRDYSVSASLGGKRARCKQCGAEMRIPAAKPAGCKKSPVEAAKGQPAPPAAQAGAAAQPAAPKPVPAQLPDVLARVNGTAINRP